MLAYLGVLEYSSTLLDRLNADPYLEPGEELEVEIRGCSIWGVEVRVEVAAELLMRDSLLMIPTMTNASHSSCVARSSAWRQRVSHRLPSPSR